MLWGKVSISLQAIIPVVHQVFWVENGEIQYPVAEITIAGQLQDMLKNMLAVADDIEHRSNIQTGSYFVR